MSVAIKKRVRAYGGPLHRIAKPRGKRGGVVLHDAHPAASGARTLFPTTVVHPSVSPRLLIGGENQRKIGKRVMKGKWRGFPIFTLTLEERATCPSTCREWLRCYGNNMPLARRHIAGEALENMLWRELANKQARHPRGFVVRLHILGDFYSLAYVDLWKRALAAFPACHVFGYTAHDPESDIGRELLGMAVGGWDRFALRFSGARFHSMGAETIEKGAATPHIVCPAQLDKTDCCATCALCWHSERTIAFNRH